MKNPISCEDVPVMDNIVACEGKVQRIVPTGVVAGYNEIEVNRNLT